ncbi:Rho-binding antiterminator [Vibrio nigripulchritudo]|uniref:Rho-binding antiterminator n=1 Tax=Vibrio nigripulchritudo TaxID=28173 RepID=UPI0009B95636|nr:Rho-binding antiterminator [Vibrio nigripulchritudo]
MEKLMISCDKYDFIELACVFKFKVTLEMLNGETEEGVATSTKIGADRIEYLVLSHLDEDESFIQMDQIRTMTAKTPNPHFTTIHINNN